MKLYDKSENKRTQESNSLLDFKVLRSSKKFVTMIALIVAILASVLLIILYIYKNIVEYWKVRGVPHIKPAFLYGCAKGLGSKYHMAELLPKIYNELKNKGPICGIHIGFKPLAVVMDLDLVKTVLIKDFDCFRNRGFFYNPVDDPISANFMHIRDDEWKLLKTKLNPTFTGKKIKSMFNSLVEKSDNAIKTIERESALGSIEAKELMYRFACDAMGSVLFGVECDSLKDKTTKLYEMSLKSMNSYSSFGTIFLEKFSSAARYFHLKQTPEELSKFFQSLISSIVDFRSKETYSAERIDLMNILMAAMKTGDVSLNQATAHSFFYFFVGTETPTMTLTYTLYELSVHQQIQEKARKEVLKVISRQQNELTYDAVEDLDYLDKIVKESLRKYPISVKTQRETVDDYKIPNTNIVIEKGCIVVIPILGIHHDPELYPEPEKFDPSRFDKDKVSQRHPCAYLPFGDGPRICPGNRISMLEMKIVLAKILMHYSFSLDKKLTKLPIKAAPKRHLMRPNDGIFIKFEKL